VIRMARTNFSYIGIDDTDNLETRGTGFRARQLVGLLQDNHLARGIAVTRHQLLLDDRVPYTSHNSSACIVIDRNDRVEDDALMDFCRSFLLEVAAPGSDVGLCLANYEQAYQVIKFGQKAKTELVEQDEARSIAKKLAIKLEGLTGDHQGIIGSLSAVGLHLHGNDGRYIWPRDSRKNFGQALSVTDVLKNLSIDKVALLDGEEVVDADARIWLGDWARAVRIDQEAILLVERIDVRHEYKVLEKEIIKSVRP